MATPKITNTISPQEDFEDTAAYADYLAGLLARNLREVLWLLTGNLDVQNIKAKSITADRMSVKELSAITADLGEVTAGIITGLLIRTAASGQRMELSSSDNLLKAINNLGNTITMKSNVGTTPDIEFSAAVGDFVRFYLLPGIFSIDSTLTSTDIAIASGKGINLYPAGGYKVRLPLWDSLFNNGNGRTLQDELNEINARLLALETAGP
ncbi:hypothetical protein D3C72_245100 [compost metagenome]